MDIESVINEMNQLHKEVESMLALIRQTRKDSIPKAIRLGELLTQCKEQTEYGEHGKWGPFIKEKLSFSQQSASVYTRVYEASKKGPLPDVDNLNDLCLLLFKVGDEEERKAILEEFKVTGEPIREIHARHETAKGISNHSRNGGKQTKSQPVGEPADPPPDVPADPPPDDEPPEEPEITKGMWDLWKMQDVRNRILATLRTLDKESTPGALNAEQSDDLRILRRMLDIDLDKVIKKLEKKEKAAATNVVRFTTA